MSLKNSLVCTVCAAIVGSLGLSGPVVADDDDGPVEKLIECAGALMSVAFTNELPPFTQEIDEDQGLLIDGDDDRYGLFKYLGQDDASGSSLHWYTMTGSAKDVNACNPPSLAVVEFAEEPNASLLQVMSLVEQLMVDLPPSDSQGDGNSTGESKE